MGGAPESDSVQEPFKYQCPYRYQERTGRSLRFVRLSTFERLSVLSLFLSQGIFAWEKTSHFERRANGAE